MNGKDKQDLNVVLERMNQSDRDREQMHTDIKFIKENLFNPKEGLWAEVKDNSRFRENTSKWHPNRPLKIVSNSSMLVTWAAWVRNRSKWH